MIFENEASLEASGETAEAYWQDIGSPEMAVLADPARAVLTQTPWAADALPGKCVVTPEMEMLGCYSGHGNEVAMETIVDLWSSGG